LILYDFPLQNPALASQDDNGIAFLIADLDVVDGVAAGRSGLGRFGGKAFAKICRR